MYVITLASNPDNLLDIIDTKILKQKSYPKQNMTIVGRAKDYEEAIGVAARIIVETMNAQGNTDIRSYLKKRHRKRRECV